MRVDNDKMINNKTNYKIYIYSHFIHKLYALPHGLFINLYYFDILYL